MVYGMLVVVLPVFNEDDGIENFLIELKENLKSYSPLFVVVDDKSTDNSYTVLKKMKDLNFPLIILRNELNCGHGFSVLKGLKAAVKLKPDSILLCDGDGQFDGTDVKKIFEIHIRNSYATVEGVRKCRSDPWFRHFISSATRFLVWIASGTLPKDANTPLRVFAFPEIEHLLTQIESNCLIPNLAISSITRKLRMPIIEVAVRSLPPRRQTDSIDQWNQKSNLLPSKRLLKFMYLALFSWIRIVLCCVSVKKLVSHSA